MATLIATHEVEDVDHWLSSPKREEIMGPLGITVRTFVGDPGSKTVGLIAEIPDLDAWRAMMESEAGAEAMKYDGVKPETLVILLEA